MLVFTGLFPLLPYFLFLQYSKFLFIGFLYTQKESISMIISYFFNRCTIQNYFITINRGYSKSVHR